MKQSLHSMLIKSRDILLKHSPELLTGVGVAGMVTTAVLAVKATPKAMRLVEAYKKEAKKEKLTTIETVKTSWKCYIPAAATCIASIACIVGASSTNVKRNAALATAYSISETAFRDYKEKVIETVGEKKDREIQDAVAKKRINDNPTSTNEVIITSRGETLCYDSLSGRYFKSDIEAIRKAENVINHRMLSEMYVSLNEFYSEIGLDNIVIGDRIGWHVDKGCFEIYFSSQLTDAGEPCLVVNYSIAPKYGFDSLY